jgi:hypothetical protein
MTRVEFIISGNAGEALSIKAWRSCAFVVEHILTHLVVDATDKFDSVPFALKIL